MTNKRVGKLIHSYEQEIKCPYCNHVFNDSWEYFQKLGDGDEKEIDCQECEKTFLVTYNLRVSYSSLEIIK